MAAVTSTAAAEAKAVPAMSLLRRLMEPALWTRLFEPGFLDPASWTPAWRADVSQLQISFRMAS